MPRYLTETLGSVEGNHNLDDEQIEADDLQTSCLSSDIPGEHLHKLAAKMERQSKACHFLHLIAAVKTVKAQENMQPYTHCQAVNHSHSCDHEDTVHEGT
jgi:hypothetical protein